MYCYHPFYREETEAQSHGDTALKWLVAYPSPYMGHLRAQPSLLGLQPNLPPKLNPFTFLFS